MLQQSMRETLGKKVILCRIFKDPILTVQYYLANTFFGSVALYFAMVLIIILFFFSNHHSLSLTLVTAGITLRLSYDCIRFGLT